MRISDWSSDVCSSDLQFIERPGGVHLLANDIAGPSAAFGIEHHGCEGGENIADAVAGVRWTAGRRRGGRRLHGWHDLLSDPGGQIARRGDVKLFLATDMIGDGGHRLAGRSCNGRSEEHTSELQSLMRISYAVFCLKKKNKN